MFDSALIRRPGLRSGRYDIGRLLETLMYYQRVHLVLDLQFFLGLVEQIGADGLRDVLSLPHVTSQLVAPELAVVRTNRQPFEMHRAAYVRFHGQEPRRDSDAIGAIHEFISRRNEFKDVTHAEWQRVLRKSQKTKYTRLLGSEEKTHLLLWELINDEQAVKSVIQTLSSEMNLPLSQAALARFEILPLMGEDGWFTVGSSPWRSLFGSADLPPDFAWGKVLSRLFEYSIDLQLAGAASADVIVSDELSELAIQRVVLTLSRTNAAQEQIGAFQELVFEDARYFGGAFNSGDISFAKAISLIEKAADLRKWASKLTPTDDLISEYVKAVSGQPFLDKAAPSTFRFFTMTGVGAGLGALGPLGAAAGLALSAFDQFILSKLANGWRPSTFVNRMKAKID